MIRRPRISCGLEGSERVQENIEGPLAWGLEYPKVTRGLEYSNEGVHKSRAPGI